MSFFDKKANIQFVLLLILLLAFFAFKYFTRNKEMETGQSTPTQSKTENRSQQENKTEQNSSDNSPNISPKVLEILDYVLKNKNAPQGYVGGRIFTNREKKLPIYNKNSDLIKYWEWDVNPKVKNQNRGTERLITGSDNSAYYTNDHYKTFTKIKS
ncbi:MAG: ribonuclease domain-containing protein [Saprospiraceae bacterium]